MMAALIARNVTLGVRTLAFGAALFVHGTLLTGFLVLWSGGVPLLPGTNLYEQQCLVQLAVLALLLPWAAARLGPGERGDEAVLLSAMTAAQPSRVVLTQAAALGVLLATIVLSGFPMMLIARQIASVSLSQALPDLLPPLGVAAAATASVLVWSRGMDDRLAGWLGATGSTVVITAAIAMSLPRPAMAPGLLAIALVAVAACAARADASLVYLSERRR